MIARLREAIGRAGASPPDRADLGVSLGKALDKVGAYDAAFLAYVAANRASRDGAGLAIPGAGLVTDKRPDNFLHIGLIEFDYDRVVADPRPVVERLLAHCGLPGTTPASPST